MRKIIAYNFLTLNGFYKGLNEDFSWHRHGNEESAYSEEMLAENNMLLFGRKTYETMAGFWPTPAAKDLFPKVADGMNRAEKLVFSNTLEQSDWENTRFIKGDVIEKIKTLKQSPGKNMAILGSGSIITLFTNHQLIDEYQFMIDPVAIGEGVPVFSGIRRQLLLELTQVKKFSSGIVLLYYKPL